MDALITDAVWMFLAGGLCCMLAHWVEAYFCFDAGGEMFVSTDERIALTQTEALQAEFVETGIRRLSRRGIWERINWIWKSARVTALSSKHLPAIIGLSMVWILAFLIACKTLLAPRAYDLRILLGGKEFVFYLVSGKDRRPKSAA